MKKLLVLLLLVLVAGLGGLGYYAYQSGWLLEEDLGDASQVSASQTSDDVSNKEKAQLGVIKPFKSEADAMEALSNEHDQNSDTVGWLYFPGTTINNSVVQSFNNTYYLRKTERKKESIYGCYFADFSCSFGSREDLSPNTIIYGHSDLKDDPEGPKFSQLFKLTDEEFARTHPDISFSTLEDKMKWQIFAVLYTTSDWDYIEADLTGNELVQLVGQAKKESIYTYDVPVGANDKILTLSTCAVKYGTQGNQRFVVMAKLMPPEYEGSKSVELSKNASTSRP